MYYKVIGNGTILDVMQNPQFVTYQPRNKIVVLSQMKNACGVLSSDGSTVWHVIGWRDIPLPDVQSIQLVEIDEDEYELLQDAIGTEDHTSQEPTTEQPATPTEITLEYIKAKKIQKMNEQCEGAIISGVDVTLSDGGSHHFDLTIEDQINLISLKEMVLLGTQEIPYHESGCLCKMYSPTDIAAILTATSNHKTYHVTYFNSLKAYINSLQEIEAVDNVRYGMLIPEQYCSEVLLAILRG